MRIYLAGKISKNDWRGLIVSDLDRAIHHVSCGEIPPLGDDSWPVLSGSIFGVHDYVGPYFVGCDHGCFHGPTTHGFIPRQLTHSTEDGYVDHSLPGTRYSVARLCLLGVARADLIYAWLDESSCHGTLVELGYAAALKKRIWISGPKYLDELWLSVTLAEKFSFGFSDPRTMLHSWIDRDFRSMPYEKYLQTPHWKTIRKAALIRAGFRCQVCNTSQEVLHVHHRTYERLGCEADDDLTVLCNRCHATFHANGKLAR